MNKKFICSVLVVALLNLLGCYSHELVKAPELEQAIVKDDIIVTTKYGKEYQFSESNYYVENDTLYGETNVRELSFEGKFAFWEIESIQLEDIGSKDPTLMMVSQYQKIESETGKPDEIYLTKFDSTRYHFMEYDYYIENDTLYGEGKLILDREQLLDKKIALADIDKIEFVWLNGVTTGLLIFGVVAIIVLLLALESMETGMSGWGGTW